MKAARLAQLVQAGYPAPPGFCLPAEAYRRHVLAADPARLRGWLERGQLEALRAWILERPLEPETAQALLNAYRRLQPQAPRGVAVRSSSSAEDLPGRSFAGLYTSVLDVSSEAGLLDAVRACWASAWNDAAVAYLQQAGIDPAAPAMAVLVQAMAPAALAGVIFTQVSAREPHIARIEFARAGGEALVSGEARGRGLLVDRRTGRPVRAHAPERELDVSRLLLLALQVEALLGRPQDIEWAMDERGVLWILQSRPITGELVSGFGLAEGEEDEWLLTYDEPFSPLGCEIAVARYRYWVAAINASFKTRFPAEMQVHDGLLYYRPGWRSAGFPLSVWMNLWRLAAWLGSGRTHRRYVERILPDYLRRLEAIEGAELAELDGPALLGRLHAAVELYLEFQYSSYAIGAAATLSAALLDRACRLLFGPQSPWNALDFLTGLDDVSIQRELEVHRLGRLLQAYLPPGSPPCPDDLAALWQQLDPAGPFWTELQAFLRTYGYLWADRYPRDPAWELNQEALTTSLWTAAQAAPEGDLAARHRQQQARRAQAVAQAAARLTNPFTRWVFSVLLRRAERLFPFKENRNHATYGGMLAIRKVARELGRRLQRRSLLETAEDLFFLELSEIDTLWKNPRSASWLGRQIEQRKAAYQRSRGRIHQHIPAPHREEAPDAAAEAIEIRGEPCSPGLARGPARLVSGPGELQRVRPGEIVVCSQLRPAWSAVFARAGGVVIEMGSLLSHGSTLAREYGIPAVINVADITGLVRENDWLVVDGNLGRVAIERRATPNGQGDEQ